MEDNKDLDVILDLLYCPVYFRVLIYKNQIDDVFINTLTEQMMRGIGAS